MNWDEGLKFYSIRTCPILKPILDQSSFNRTIAVWTEFISTNCFSLISSHTCIPLLRAKVKAASKDFSALELNLYVQISRIVTQRGNKYIPNLACGPLHYHLVDRVPRFSQVSHIAPGPRLGEREVCFRIRNCHWLPATRHLSTSRNNASVLSARQTDDFLPNPLDFV